MRRSHFESAITLFLMTNPEVVPGPGDPETVGVWSWPHISFDAPNLHQLEDLSPNDWVLPFTARITVSCIPPGEGDFSFLSRSTSSPIEDPNHAVLILRGLLGISLPAEKSLLAVTNGDIHVRVETIMEGSRRSIKSA